MNNQTMTYLEGNITVIDWNLRIPIDKIEQAARTLVGPNAASVKRAKESWLELFTRYAFWSGWEFVHAPDAGMVCLHWTTGPEPGVDLRVLEKIADLIEEGSFVELTDEDRVERWRMVFDGQSYEVVEGTVCWDHDRLLQEVVDLQAKLHASRQLRKPIITFSDGVSWFECHPDDESGRFMFTFELRDADGQTVFEVWNGSCGSLSDGLAKVLERTDDVMACHPGNKNLEMWRKLRPEIERLYIESKLDET